jgi:hypothetical protein
MDNRTLAGKAAIATEHGAPGLFGQLAHPTAAAQAGVVDDDAVPAEGIALHRR